MCKQRQRHGKEKLHDHAIRVSKDKSIRKEKNV